MDNNRVSVFELRLPSSWFDTWFVSVNTVVGIYTALFFNILNLSENSILIKYDTEVDTDKLSIQLRLDKCTIDYELPLMDIETDVLDIPDTEYMVDMKMKSAFFFGIVDKLKKFGGDSFELDCSEESVRLFATTIEAGKMSAEIKIEDLVEYAIGEERGSGSFGMNYIHNIAVFYKVAEMVNVHFTNGEPLKVVYVLGDDASVVFYLAPKFDVNDE
jgi:proliferating cell nuclear antigen PCNA